MSRGDFSHSEEPDDTPVWSMKQWWEAANEHDKIVEQVSLWKDPGPYELDQGPAYVIEDDGSILYFHRLAIIEREVSVYSKPLCRLDVLNSREADWVKFATKFDSVKKVKGYSLQVQVMYGDQGENSEYLYATLRTKDPDLVKKIQHETKAKIEELVSLNSVREWLIENYGSIIENITTDMRQEPE